jgi:short-subunit dehydrogenase involved in D-alanine esterification of teichoic acids
MTQTCVITGAASGIGAATAHYLRERSEWAIACDLCAVMTGQILFVDGGAECLVRGERSW